MIAQNVSVQELETKRLSLRICTHHAPAKDISVLNTVGIGWLLLGGSVCQWLAGRSGAGL